MYDRPKCKSGNTSNPNGYCDGSHLNKKSEWYEKEIFFSIGINFNYSNVLWTKINFRHFKKSN